MSKGRMITDDTPREYLQTLKQAHAAGRLLVFCGAGVSRFAEFPGFGSLINQVVNEVSATIKADYQEHGLEVYQADLEKELKAENPHYPRAIQYLITILDRLGFNGREIVLSHIIPSFQERYKACRENTNLLTTHKKILDLATTENATRLVTTNWDDLFHLADSRHPQRQRLSSLTGVQPPTRWTSDHIIYHCHGYIDVAAVPATTSIILTDRDYETIYSNANSDAQRILAGLFEEYTTLFIGYSVETEVKDLTKIYRQSVEHFCRSKNLPESHKQSMLSNFYVAVPYHKDVDFLVKDYEQWQQYQRHDSYPIKCVNFQVPDSSAAGQSPDINSGLQQFIDYLNLSLKPTTQPFKSPDDLPPTPDRPIL